MRVLGPRRRLTVPVCAESGRHMGMDPIMITVGSEIDDIGEDFLAGVQSLPHQREHGAWHVGMADDRVGRADNLSFREAGDVEKDAIGVGDDALDVGLGDDDLR